MRWRTLCLAGALLSIVPHLAAQSPLDRRVSLSVREATLSEALLRLKREQGAPLAWRGDQLPPLKRVTVEAHNLPLGQVLGQLLRGTLLVPRITASGTVVLIPGTSPAVVSPRETGIHALDQLVVTGSAVDPGPNREQPTTVNVVTRADLDAAPHQGLPAAMRTFLPGLVLWDHGGAGPPPVVAGVRGVASFTSRAPKLYIDGVESASSELFTLLDLRGVERIELIPGPQGAALYGPEAIAGVIQLETRKGSLGTTHLTPGADLLAGGLAREVDGSSFLREAAASAAISGPAASVHSVVSWSQLRADAPLAEAWRTQVAGQLQGATWRLTWSGRLAQHDAPIERIAPNGALLTARAAEPLVERGASVRLTHAAETRLSHSLTAGVHRIAGSREPFRSPILPPTLPLGATNEVATRSALRWAGHLDLSRLSLTLGAELSRRNLSRTARQSGGAADLSALYREALDARGGFGQLRLRTAALVLSAGGRVDRISSVGAEAGTPWAATAGASWSAPLGLATLRLRAAWGRALRPPEPGMSAMLTAGTIAQEPNSGLASEQQSGWELGAELYAAGGAWFRITWFDQHAEELIQQVDLRRTVDARRLYQFQNVGAITNRGLELDAGTRWGRFSAAGRLNLVKSRVAALAPNYTGDFAPGDAPLEVPASMASVALRHEHRGTRLEAGATWIGPWTGYDWRLIQRVEAGDSPLRDRVREYWLDYDGVLRPFAGVTLALTRTATLGLRVEWPLGQDALLRDNLTPAVGRTITVGLRYGPTGDPTPQGVPDPPRK